MGYCVVEYKSGALEVLTRQQRETQLSVLIDVGEGVGSRVVGSFSSKEEAEEMIDRINRGEIILKDFFKSP